MDSSKAVVTVNDRPAVSFRVSNGDLSPLKRAELTAGRLKPLAATGDWTSISVKPVGTKRAQVMAGEQVICIATAADAKKAGTSAVGLAQSWATQLRRLFAMPPVMVEPAEITVPEGETRTASVGGALTSALLTSDADPKVATSAVHKSQRGIVVTGKAVGRCTIDVACEGYKASLVVNVRRYAGQLARSVRVDVTGNPAPSWLIAQAAAQTAPETVSVQPGASADYGKPKLLTNTAKPGSCVKALVPVTITGPGLIPVSLSAPIDVCNRELPRKPLTGLFYSNNPEQVKKFQTLYAAKFTSNERTRLLYHHQNMMGSRMQFTIEIINAGPSTASLHAVSGITSPILDTVVVGYLAGRTFVRDYLDNVGRIYDLPSMSRLVLYTDDVGAKQTVSGIIDMQLLSGENVYVRVRGDQPGTMKVANGDIGSIADASVPSELSEEVYPSPVKQLSASYRVGEKWAFIRVGKNAITDATQKRQLYGNYGVLYDISVDLSNPTGDAKTVKILFEPTAGPASGIFLIGGKVVGLKIINPPNEFEVESIRLQPGESKQVQLQTIPLAGSAYPATIIVRS